MKLKWQSKLVLLIVAPVVAVDLEFALHTWAGWCAPAAVWTVGLSAILGLVTWKLRAATPAAAVTGTLITGSLMFSTISLPYQPWRAALTPVLAVALLAYAATRTGHGHKTKLGTAEGRNGRGAAQVTANLGMAALVCSRFTASQAGSIRWLNTGGAAPGPLLTAGLAALAEAAADTVSSELGQVFGGQPRTITTLRRARTGQNGAISLAGTLAGASAAAVVAGCGTWALRGGWTAFTASLGGGVFGFLFDSVLGATLEERGWLNNDAVNFLSTVAAAGFALIVSAWWR